MPIDFVTQRALQYKRRKSRTVSVGQVGVGGMNPIRVQSMCTSDTKDTVKVVSEIRGLVEAGCEIVRVTVPTQADCDNLPNIRAAMKKEGLKVPLVADIHFTPSIAMKAVEYVEKVRINPGNFVDKKLFKVVEYTDQQYQEELQRLHEKFLPLVLKCKEYGIAMRIGTNHGSLSDRIMNRFGDSPEGMVESALEFARICEDQGFRDIIFSMKASNVQVMTAAYRLLAQRLVELGSDYPFHLGVTEAGAGQEGRVKSAAGIGALLEDGIGDTIRVSLTEDAVYEVPVAYQIAQAYNLRHCLNQGLASPPPTGQAGLEPPPQRLLSQAGYFVPRSQQNDSPTSRRRPTPVFNIGSHPHGFTEPVRVWLGVQRSDTNSIQEYIKSRAASDQPLEGVEVDAVIGQSAVEELTSVIKPNTSLAIRVRSAAEVSQFAFYADKLVAVVSPSDDLKPWAALDSSLLKDKAFEWRLNIGDASTVSTEWVRSLEKITMSWPVSGKLFSIDSGNGVYANRSLAQILDEISSQAHHHLYYRRQKNEAPLLASSTTLGALLMDGIGESIQFELENEKLDETVSLAYNILQGVRLRVSKTEYISCPSCGRTLFDLQTTTDKVRQSTSHLKGVKIAVMGCIVNGPGEMADADFGYVGTGPKKISLYVGKECVERNLPEEVAVMKLVELIKKNGRWVEPELAS